MNYTDQELILQVDNDPNATPRERDLATRLDEALQEAERLPEEDIL